MSARAAWSASCEAQREASLMRGGARAAAAACIIIFICDGAGVQVVAFVPVAGPVPPPYMVVKPDATASSTIYAAPKGNQ